MHRRITLLLLATLATSLSLVVPLPKFSSQVAGLPRLDFGMNYVWADTPDKAPAGLVNSIAALDAAANKRDLNAAMQFYDSDFKNSDGLTKDTLKRALESLWQKYPNLQYRTELVKWERTGDTYKVQTATRAQGNRVDGATRFKLDAQLTSVQTYSNRGSSWQIAQQEILAEGSSLTSGEKPPEVELRMPSKIGVGREYALDAIVTEPLGASLLLGAVLEESVSSDSYLKESTVNLEALRSGGMFRIGKAPYNEGDRWVSVVLVRENGITITGKRLQVSKDLIGEQYKSLPESATTPSRIRPSNQQTL